MAKQKKKFYVVWKGVEPGVYSTWTECERQVKGFEGAMFKSFPTIEEAQAAYAGGAAEHFHKSDRQKVNRLNIESLPPDKRPIVPSLSVDAACSGNPGKMEYRGVDTATGREIFHQGPFDSGTNNIGEFLALVHGLALLQKQGMTTLPVYSDSRTAQSWVRQRQCKSKLSRTERNAQLFELVSRAEFWLQHNSWTNPIYKWDTDLWGEIPADFGRK